MRLIRRGAWTGLLLCAAIALSSLPGARAAALPPLSHHGRWLVDPQGRVVILHGVQIDRYESNAPIEHIDLPPSAVRFMAAQGFNVARVSIAFAGVEPALGHFDDAYIQQYLAFDRELAQAGVYDLVDMMQGQYAAEFEGAGFPSWMVITDGVPNVPGPFPQSYLYDPAEERAWDNFWANTPASDGVGLQDHYASGLRYLARSFSGEPAFLGFDLLNEPWPGSHWPTCANPRGCPVFDQELAAFYRRLIPALRLDDPRHLVFYEPHALFDQGAATNIGSIGDPNAVFTFHNYCLGDQPGLPQSDPGQDCGIEEQMVLANAESQSGTTGDGLLEDEWGNTPSVPLLQRMAGEADQRMVGWSYWAYEDCCQSPGAIVSDGAKDPSSPGNLNLPVLEALVRPYPQLISGTPAPWSFDPQTKRFSLSYSTRRVAAGGTAAGAPGPRFPARSPTEIFVPQLQYPHGYRVTVTGATVASPPSSGRLLLCSAPDADTVSVTLAPDVNGTTDPPAAETSPPSCQGPGSSPQNTPAAGGRGSSLIRLPSALSCRSGRHLVIHLHSPRHDPLRDATFRVNGRTVRVLRGHVRARVDLRGLPRGRYTVSIVAHTRSGRTLRAHRTYHTCQSRRPRRKTRRLRRR